MNQLQRDVCDAIIPDNELIPGGAFGRIYKVKTNVIDLPVIAKVFKRNVSRADDEYQRLQDLAQIDDSRFSTPIPYDLVSLPFDWRVKKRSAVVMEYVEGDSLDDMTVEERAPFRPLVENLIEALIELGISRHDGPKLSELIVRSDDSGLCMLDMHDIVLSNAILPADLYSKLLSRFDEQEKHTHRNWYMPSYRW